MQFSANKILLQHSSPRSVDFFKESSEWTVIRGWLFLVHRSSIKPVSHILLINKYASLLQDLLIPTESYSSLLSLHHSRGFYHSISMLYQFENLGSTATCYTQHIVCVFVCDHAYVYKRDFRVNVFSLSLCRSVACVGQQQLCCHFTYTRLQCSAVPFL